MDFNFTQKDFENYFKFTKDDVGCTVFYYDNYARELVIGKLTTFTSLSLSEVEEEDTNIKEKYVLEVEETCRESGNDYCGNKTVYTKTDLFLPYCEATVIKVTKVNPFMIDVKYKGFLQKFVPQGIFSERDPIRFIAPTLLEETLLLNKKGKKLLQVLNTILSK